MQKCSGCIWQVVTSWEIKITRNNSKPWGEKKHRLHCLIQYCNSKYSVWILHPCALALFGAQHGQVEFMKMCFVRESHCFFLSFDSLWFCFPSCFMSLPMVASTFPLLLLLRVRQKRLLSDTRGGLSAGVFFFCEELPAALQKDFDQVGGVGCQTTTLLQPPAGRRAWKPAGRI